MLNNFPGVRLLNVSPTTGDLAVDLSGADERTKRMLRDAAPTSYVLLEQPGGKATLQVTGPLPKNVKRRGQ